MTNALHERMKSQIERLSAPAIVYGTTACLAVWLFVLIPVEVGKPVTLFGAAPEGLHPRTMPRIVLAALAALSLWGLVTSGRGVTEPVERPTVAVAITATASFAFAAALVPLGFVVASAITVFALALILGGRNLLGLLLAGLGVPVTLYLVFTRALHIALPPGTWGV